MNNKEPKEANQRIMPNNVRNGNGVTTIPFLTNMNEIMNILFKNT
jgi:hypothetical protein